MFIELGEYFFNADEVIAIKKVGCGATVITKGGTYTISNVEDKQWKKLIFVQAAPPYYKEEK